MPAVERCQLVDQTHVLILIIKHNTQTAGVKVADTNGTPWNAFSEGILAANPELLGRIVTLLNKN